MQAAPKRHLRTSPDEEEDFKIVIMAGAEILSDFTSFVVWITKRLLCIVLRYPTIVWE